MLALILCATCRASPGGKVDLSDPPIANVLELHNCADRYRCENSKHTVLNGLASSTSECYFSERLKIADEFGSSALKESVLVFNGKEFRRLRESEEVEVKVPEREPIILKHIEDRNPLTKCCPCRTSSTSNCTLAKNASKHIELLWLGLHISSLLNIKVTKPKKHLV